MSAKFYSLHGASSSLVLEHEEGRWPIWRHFGARIEDVSGLSSWAETTPLSTFSLDENQPLRVVPLFGNGYFDSPACLAHRNGQDWAQEVTHCDVKASNTDIIITARDEIAQMAWEHRITLLTECDVYSFQTRITNLSDGALQVQRLMAGALPLSSDRLNVHSFSGRHNNEFTPVTTKLTRAGWQQVNRRGLTSHNCPPYARAQSDSAGAFSGEVIAAHLAWSGNHEQMITWSDYGHHIWQSGAWYAPGEIRLAQGQSLTSPEWIVTFSAKGENGAAQNLHQHIRHISPLWQYGKMRPRPVHLNTWEALYFDHDEAELRDLAKSAAGLGIERFILDDGWFGGRNDDTTSLGDWVADPVKYPKGLGPIAEYVKSLGMEFGLWVEPEMISPDSALYHQHPDWALQLSGRKPLTARHQLVLDMSREDVQGYLFEKLDNLLRAHPIDYLKWDHNRDLTQAGSGGYPAYTAQVHGTYQLLDKLRRAHPSVEIEACAGGGGRIDAGILRYAHRVWTSDCIDALSRMQIQRGFLQYLPPEIMGSHIGASPAHSTGRMQDINFRAAVALTGHFGIELDPRGLSDKDRAQLLPWIAFYKASRATLHGGQFWQGVAGDHIGWIAQGSPQEFYLFIYRLAPTEQRFPPHVKLPFLNEGLSYRLERVDPLRGQFDGFVSAAFAKLDAHSADYAASVLKHIGLPLPFMKAERCLILKATALEKR